MLNLNLTELGAFELAYTRQLIGDIQNQRRKPRVPCIEPLEIPFLFAGRIFACSVTNIQKPYYRAGYLYYEVQGVSLDASVTFPEIPGGGSTSVDAARRLITLNSLDLVVFPRFSQSVRLRFEAMPWLDRLTFALWEYRGSESDSIEDRVEALQAQLATMDYKLDQIRNA